jgi:predicted DCC family thiol-disulfide oxidoreductase YuxK
LKIVSESPPRTSVPANPQSSNESEISKSAIATQSPIPNQRITNATLTIVFYDGVCGLCNRLNAFLIPRDRHRTLRFAPLQGELARRTLTSHQRDPSDLDTVYVIAEWQTPRERVLERSRAILHTLDQLGGGWKLLARVGAIVPLTLADAGYRVVARNRYRMFGRFDSCPVPPPDWRDRFVGPL